MDEGSALRTRLEGSLEVVETAAADMERATDRLRESQVTELRRVVALRHGHALTSAQAKVVKLAVQEPLLEKTLARLELARKTLDSEIHRQADKLGYRPGTVEQRAKQLETERVLFNGGSFPWKLLPLFPAVAVVLWLFARAQHLDAHTRSLMLLTVGGGWALIIALQALFAPKMLVTTASLRIGRERVQLDAINTVRFEQLRGNRGGRFYRATIVERTGKERPSIKLPSLPDDFLHALRAAKVRTQIL